MFRHGKKAFLNITQVTAFPSGEHCGHVTGVPLRHPSVRCQHTENKVYDIKLSSFMSRFYDKIAKDEYHLKQEQKSIWN